MTTSKHTTSPIFPVLAIAAVVFLLASLFAAHQILTNGDFLGLAPPTQQPIAPERAEPPIERVEMVIADTDATRGDADASVVVVEYSDYRCPFCGATAGTNEQTIAQLRADDTWSADDEPLVPALVRDYVDTGRVLFVYKDLPLLGIESFFAASAARCSGEQGRYWEYHDELFALQTGFHDSQAYTRDTFIGIARQLGLDTDAFAACFDSDRHLVTARANKDEAERLGVTNTPTFFVNGIRLEGAHPYSKMKPVIESELRTNP